MSRLADLAHRRARRILVVAAVLFVFGGVFGGPVAGMLGADSTDFQASDAPNVVAAQRIERATGRASGLGLVAVVRARGDVRVDRAARARVEEIGRALGGARDVDRVVTPLQDPSLLSADGRTVLLAARVSEDNARPAAELLRARYPAPEVLVGGTALVQNEIGDRVTSDLGRAELLAFPILFLLSLWVFRGVVAALLPLLVAGLSVLITFVVLRLVNDSVTGLSIFALNLVTGLGLGLAIDYSLFVVSRYREELERHGPGLTALRATLATAGRTVLFSALTVAAALASLLVFPLRFLYSMGIGGAVVALVAAGVALVVLPAVLVLLGARVNALSPARWRRSLERDARAEGSGAWYRLSRAVMRRPAIIATLSAALLLLAGVPFLGVEFKPADVRNLPAGSQARQATELVERTFPRNAVDPVRAVVTAPRSARAEIAAYARRLPGDAAAPRFLGRDTWLVALAPRGDPTDAAGLRLVRSVRAIAAPGPVVVGGEGAAFLDQQASLKAGLPIAIALLAVTTFAVLFVMTGSVLLPLKALVLNLLTVSAAFGILVLVFQDGHLESVLDFKSAGGLEATQPVLLFAVSFGLATDYGVFLLSRIKEARDAGLGEREAVAAGLERTGRIVTAAALLFCVAIGAFATSGVLFIKQVGVGTALAVAIDASIVRALLVPSLMALLGRRNWWAPGPLRRLHARIGIAEA